MEIILETNLFYNTIARFKTLKTLTFRHIVVENQTFIKFLPLFLCKSKCYIFLLHFY